MISLSNEIKSGRQKLNYTQQDIAKKLGISLATYVKYENNPLSMELKDFIKVCEILGKDFMNIFFTSQLYNLYKNETYEN